MLKPLLRMTVPVVLFVLAGAALIRQPTITSLDYGDRARSSPAALRQHVDFLTNDVRPRSVHHLENLNRAAVYIADHFRASGGAVTLQEYGGGKYRNVIARFGPPTGRALVVGAHYDAFSETRGDLPGADDNASGTAGLIELARLLGTRRNLPRPVIVVAYSTEEPPFFGSEEMGSFAHASALTDDVEGAIVFEMIGYFHGTQTWPNTLFRLLYPERGDFIAVGGGWNDRRLVRTLKAAIRGAGSVKVYSFTGPRATLDASDQRNYWKRGIPAVLVTDTAYVRNPNYHTLGDTAETLDYETMGRVVDGVFNAVTR